MKALFSVLPLGKILVVLVASGLSFSVMAEAGVAADAGPPTEAEAAEEDLGYVAETFDWLIGKRNEWSGRVSDMGGRLDGFMGGEEAITRANSSFLKVTLEAEQSKFNGFKFKPKFRTRIDLPLTKEKYKFVLETDPDQGKSIEERTNGSLPTVDEQTSNGLYGSVRYLFAPSFWDELSLDAGVRARLPPDPFARARANKTWQLKSPWQLRYLQELFIFETSGFGAYSKFDIERPIRNDYFLRSTSTIDFKERQENTDFLQQFSFFHEIDLDQALQYNLGFSANRKGNTRISNVFFTAKWRRRLHEEWLFGEIQPGLSFPREHEFSTNPYIVFKLEVLFSRFDDGQLEERWF